MKNIKFLFFGALFGFILVKGEVISWFRIQEMFRFQAFHMYGVIGSALAVGLVSVQLIKRFKLKTVSGEDIKFTPKPFEWSNLYGGIVFGLGWALTGACPGPVYVLIGAGYPAYILVLVSALAGVFMYGLLKKKLPH